jgi:ribosomal protein S27AE
MREDSKRERPAEQTSAEGMRAAQSREESGRTARGRHVEPPAEGMLTLVCFKCGKEYFFADGNPPEDMSCEKCGNTVFRSFFSADPSDDSVRDFMDSTARDLDPDDAEGDSLPGDLIDLNRD